MWLVVCITSQGLPLHGGPGTAKASETHQFRSRAEFRRPSWVRADSRITLMSGICSFQGVLRPAPLSPSGKHPRGGAGKLEYAPRRSQRAPKLPPNNCPWSSAQFRPTSGDVRPSLVEQVSNWPNSAGVGQALDKSWPTSGQCGRSWPNRLRPESGQIGAGRPNCGTHRLCFAEVGPSRTRFDQ